MEKIISFIRMKSGKVKEIYTPTFNDILHLLITRLSVEHCTMVPSYISLAYLIDFRMIKFYLLPKCWQSMEEVAFHFNLQ